MNSSLLYISPHLDDVVFSCSGKILHDVANGCDVTIATLFSSGSKMVSEEYAARKAEDKKAAEILGARCVWMDFLDAPFRSSFYNSFRRIILERDISDNPEYVTLLRKAIKDLAVSLGAEEIYAPLGIGTHIDHRLVFEAASGLSGLSVTYYEERPYVFARHAAKMRLSSIGVGNYENSMIDVRDYVESLCSLRYVKKYLPAGKERACCLNIITEDLKQPHSVIMRPTEKIVSTDEQNLLQVEAATKAYNSQVNDFFGTGENFLREVLNYGESITGIRSYSERYWQLWQVR